MLIIPRKNILTCGTIFLETWLNKNKVLFDIKDDTSKNVANSLTNFISTEKFSWYRESMGITTLSMCPYKS